MPGEASPAFQFYPKDFLTSGRVIHMSMTERGIYITLLSYCWLEGSLPPDSGQLARLVRMPAKQFDKVWRHGTLKSCFSEDGGRLVNLRLEEERKKQSDYRRRQSDRAVKRWESKPRNATALQQPHERGTATAMQAPQCSSSPSSSSSPNTPPNGGVARRASLHDASHKKHAHCGRVCLPASLFGEFVRRRNHDDADREIRDWCMEVEQVWGVDGAHANEEPGDAFEFWKSRYSERWPAKQVDARTPAWAR